MRRNLCPTGNSAEQHLNEHYTNYYLSIAEEQLHFRLKNQVNNGSNLYLNNNEENPSDLPRDIQNICNSLLEKNYEDPTDKWDAEIDAKLAARRKAIKYGLEEKTFYDREDADIFPIFDDTVFPGSTRPHIKARMENYKEKFGKN